MRILFFTQQLARFRSGVGTYAYNLASGLTHQGHQLCVVAPEHEIEALPNVRKIVVPAPVYPLTPGGWMTLAGSFARRLKKSASCHDLAFFSDAREAFRVRGCSIPVVGMVHDAYALDWQDRTLPRHCFADRHKRGLYYTILRKVEQRCYPRFDAVIANSRKVAAKLECGYGMLPGSVKTVPHGVTAPVKSACQRLKGTPSVVFVGGNFQRKGLSILIKASAKVRRHLPGIQLHIVGRDRNQPAMQTLAHKAGLSKNIHFHGWQPNEKVLEMIAGADLMAMPSFSEGFGLVYVEAMHLECPVVASTESGIREYITDGKEALFVTPGNVDEVARAICLTTGDHQLRRQLKQNGKAAAERFSVATMAVITSKILENILSRK